jgi:hypothetical protein
VGVGLAPEVAAELALGVAGGGPANEETGVLDAGGAGVAPVPAPDRIAVVVPDGVAEVTPDGVAAPAGEAVSVPAAVEVGVAMAVPR